MGTSKKLSLVRDAGDSGVSAVLSRKKSQFSDAPRYQGQRQS